MQQHDHSRRRHLPAKPRPFDAFDDREVEREEGKKYDHSRAPEVFDKRTGRRLTVFAGVVAALLLIAFVVVQYTRGSAERNLELATKESAATPPLVNVVTARAGSPTQSLTLPGETRAWYKATVYARVSGYVAKWYVDIGDHVKKGQVMAEIETPELDQQLIAAQAELKAAEAGVKVKQAEAEFARTTYERWRDSPKGVVSEQERQEKKAAYESGIAYLNAAQARVNLDKAKVEGLAALTQFKSVVAPFDGTIIDRRIDIGDLVTAGSTANTTPLFTVAQSDQIRVFVDVPQSASLGIKIDTPAHVIAKEYPSRIFDGKVARTSEAIDPSARTLRVEVDLPNSDFALVPGMYVQVGFQLHERALVQIPASALMFRTSGPQVAVVADDGTVSFHDVTIARDDGNVLEIGSGLMPNDRVALNISTQIANGDKVTPNEIDRATSAASPPANDAAAAANKPH